MCNFRNVIIRNVFMSIEVTFEGISDYSGPVGEIDYFSIVNTEIKDGN